jgi:hypothetical protein
MPIDNIVLLLGARLIMTAVVTFLAIAVWARVRDSAWMLLVIGILAGYVDILYNLLVHYGLVPDNWPAPGGVLVLPLLFVTLPWLFFALAFLVMLRRQRDR